MKISTRIKWRHRLRAYGRWTLAGIPILTTNYVAFVIVEALTGNNTLAFWSWPLVSPITYHIVEIFGIGVKK